MVIQALNIPDVEFVDVNLMEGEHLKEEYLKVRFVCLFLHQKVNVCLSRLLFCMHCEYMEEVSLDQKQN